MIAIWVGLLACVTVGLEESPANTVDLAQIPVGHPVPVAVGPNGITTIDLPAGDEARRYSVVLGSLSLEGPAMSVAVTRSEAEGPARAVLRDAKAPSLAWTQSRQSARERMRSRRRPDAEVVAEHAAAKFPEEKTFYLFAKEDGFQDPRSYVQIQARLVAVGKHCLIYVDEQDQPQQFSRAVVQEVVESFDNHIFPTCRRTFGEHRDVDRDGKFTILFTQWLGRLCDGKVALGGFVRGGDFYRDLEPPYSNQCDMMYLNASVQPGPYLRTLLAHEYTHAITFSEHVFGDYLPAAVKDDEEGWLSEAISHLAENIAGDGWANLDYRISAYLSAPNRYRLVVPDYLKAGLWRCHGSRGSTYLFLRWIVDRYGEEVLRELAQSNQSGILNIETATLTPFETLFRDWTVALTLGGVSNGLDRSLAPCSINVRGRLGKRLLAGARPIVLSDTTAALTIAPTGFCPVEVVVPANQTVRLTVGGKGTQRLQITVIRTPDELPLARVQVTKMNEAGDQIAVAVKQESGAPVQWEWVSWEPTEIPRTEPGPADRNVDLEPVEALFRATRTEQGRFTRSEPIALNRRATGELVFKMIGRDPHGQMVTAWGTYYRPTKTPTLGN